MLIDGQTEYRIVSGGRFMLDGGGMFGIIPKTLWARLRTPDELNRIEMATNCLLVRTPQQTILVDTGYGTKLSAKAREIYGITETDALVRSLAHAGVRPDDIDLVILSHLHFDHAGGATVADLEGHLYPAFPHARYIAQRGEWDDAVNKRATMTASYMDDNYLPLRDYGLLTLIDGDDEVCPGVRVFVTGGHTRCHQVVMVESAHQTVVYAGDILPTTSHLRGPYNMAYDLFPYETMTQKSRWLERAAAGGWLLVWNHDPITPAGRVIDEGNGQYRPEPVAL
ncbi:MAG: MBL fold metallo-hydrolase [Candidatus Latescibacteria bacterium]|nr:MBL fold metallo-hydrolase [Candidatus Latescibacterota bacterium]